MSTNEFDFEEEVKTNQAQSNEPDVSVQDKQVVTEQPLSDKANEDRWKNRRRMAWLSLLFMFGITLAMLFLVPDNRIESLSLIINWLYMSCTSIIGFYMGATAYVDRVRDLKGFNG